MIDYLQNEDLCSIGAKIGDHIAADEAIKTYCQKHFGKDLTIYVGPQEAMLPQDTEVPFLFVHDFQKNEGASITKAMYQCMFSVGVVVPYEPGNIQSCSTQTDKGVIVFDGQKLCSELMSFVQDALYQYKDGYQPPTTIEQMVPGITGDNLGFWEGFMIAQWDLPISIGQQNHF